MELHKDEYARDTTVLHRLLARLLQRNDALSTHAGHGSTFDSACGSINPQLVVRVRAG